MKDLENRRVTNDDLPQTLHECEDELAILSDEIGDIQSELNLDNEIEHRCEEWRVRATRALRHRQKRWGAIRRIERRLQAEAKKTKLHDNFQTQIDAMKKSHNEKMARQQKAINRVNAELFAVKRWLENKHPDEMQEIYRVADEARAKFDLEAAE